MSDPPKQTDKRNEPTRKTDEERIEGLNAERATHTTEDLIARARQRNKAARDLTRALDDMMNNKKPGGRAKDSQQDEEGSPDH